MADDRTDLMLEIRDRLKAVDERNEQNPQATMKDLDLIKRRLGNLLEVTALSDEAVQRAAEVMLRQYESQYSAENLTWRDFADDARAILAAAVGNA